MIIASSSQSSKNKQPAKNVTAYSLQKLLQIKDNNHKKLYLRRILQRQHKNKTLFFILYVNKIINYK